MSDSLKGEQNHDVEDDSLTQAKINLLDAQREYYKTKASIRKWQKIRFWIYVVSALLFLLMTIIGLVAKIGYDQDEWYLIAIRVFCVLAWSWCAWVTYPKKV